MNYKVIGNTSNGKCACGHRTWAGKPYIIARFKYGLRSICMACAGRLGGNLITLNADLVSKLK